MKKPKTKVHYANYSNKDLQELAKIESHATAEVIKEQEKFYIEQFNARQDLREKRRRLRINPELKKPYYI